MFEIGQKVVCKNSKKYGGKVPMGIVAGKVYTICGFDKCEFCGEEFVLLAGVVSGSRKECICSNIPIFPTNAFLAWRFELPNHESISNVVSEETTTNPQPKLKIEI